MKKFIGYIVAIIGLIGLTAWSFPQVKSFIENAIKFKFPSNDIVLVVSIILTVTGIFIAMKSKGKLFNKKFSEVPIYHGNKIVGYRRHY